MVQKGYNSDIEINGSNYHVQTEDWGKANPFIVTQVFKNGAVVKNIKISYNEAIAKGPTSDERAIRLAMKDQHQKILDHLLSGQSL